MVALLVSEADSEAVLAVSLAASLKASMVFSADLEAVSAVSLAASPAMLVASSADLEAVSAVLLVASLAVSLASLGVLGSSPVELHYNIPSKATEVMAMTFGRPMTGGGGRNGPTAIRSFLALHLIALKVSPSWWKTFLPTNGERLIRQYTRFDFTRRGKGKAESLSREGLRQAPQKEGGQMLCDLPPV